MRLTCSVGTRPEAIKLAPVIRTLRGRPPFAVHVVASGQHPDVAAMLRDLGADADLSLADVAALPLPEMSAALQAALARAYAATRPDMVIAQGDTTTAFAAALAAFQARIPVAHLEAGLRSGSLMAPFPEEGHRRLIARLATVHLAPTRHARQNLRAEGVDDATIAVTGNTIVDSLQAALPAPETRLAAAGERLVLLTLHRRESWGAVLEGLCDAVRDTIAKYPDVRLVVPVHTNPIVRDTIDARLAGHSRITLEPPLPYRAFLARLQQASLVMTDSGGVQEEAAALGKRVLVLRDVTDRPESLWAGLARLVGTDAEDVRAALDLELRTPTGAAASAIYGDGQAAGRVVLALERWRAGLLPLLPPWAEFDDGQGPDRSGSLDRTEREQTQ